jgi:hypothetical protein
MAIKMNVLALISEHKSTTMIPAKILTNVLELGFLGNCCQCGQPDNGPIPTPYGYGHTSFPLTMARLMHA